MKPRKLPKSGLMETLKVASSKASGRNFKSSNQKLNQQTTNQLKSSLRNSKQQQATTNKQVFVCSQCDKPILRDKFLLKACDKYWHENCLKCDRCQGRLGELGSTLYCKSNMKLCRHDYLDLFGKTGVCSVCEKLILPTEMAMKAKENVYHLECFACQLCNQRFCVGDRFYLCENKVVCQYDYDEHILPIQKSLFEQQQFIAAASLLEEKPPTGSEEEQEAEEMSGNFNKGERAESNNIKQSPGGAPEVDCQEELPEEDQEAGSSSSSSCSFLELQRPVVARQELDDTS